MNIMLFALVAIVALFALGMGGVYVFLRFIDRLFPEKEKGREHGDKGEETSQT